MCENSKLCKADCAAVQRKQSAGASAATVSGAASGVVAADRRIALIGIIVSALDSAGAVNAALSEFSDCILGRMGLPVRERGLSAISVLLDAPTDRINALTGKLGKIPDVNAKALFERA